MLLKELTDSGIPQLTGSILGLIGFIFSLFVFIYTSKTATNRNKLSKQEEISKLHHEYLSKTYSYFAKTINSIPYDNDEKRKFNMESKISDDILPSNEHILFLSAMYIDGDFPDFLKYEKIKGNILELIKGLMFEFDVDKAYQKRQIIVGRLYEMQMQGRHNHCIMHNNVNKKHKINPSVFDEMGINGSGNLAYFTPVPKTEILRSEPPEQDRAS